MALSLAQKKEPVKDRVRVKQTDAARDLGWMQKMALVRAADLVPAKVRWKAPALVLQWAQGCWELQKC